jgi:glycerol kinase
LATGFWDSPDQLVAVRQGDARFEPSMNSQHRTERRALWTRAVERAKGWDA